MKIIFDLGANQGQNLNYFLKKADIVIAVEANPKLVTKIKSNFKKFIDDKRLIIENVVLINDNKIKKIDFFLSKGNMLTSTLFPKNPNKFFKQKIKCEKTSLLVMRYLSVFDIKNIEYIKIDLEGADHLILDDLIKNNILPKYLSVECHRPEVIELLINSKYKSFKFVQGENMLFKKNVKIKIRNGDKETVNFDKHSSGPYGDDIPGPYYDKSSIFPFFLNNGLGWKDIHCSADEKINLQNIKYLPSTHSSGFRHHLRNILPSLIKALKYKISIIKK